MDLQRVALVARPAQGGIRSHLILLSRHLDRSVFQPRLLAPQSLLDSLPTALIEGSAALAVTTRLNVNDIETQRRLARLLKPGEIVHAHGIRAGWISALARGRQCFPLIVTFHNVPPNNLFGRFAVAYISRRADRVIAVSQAIAAPLPPEKTQVIPNGIEIERFQRISRNEARTSFDIADNEFIVGCIARLSHEKGVDLFIDAARNCPEMQFVVVGDGPERSALEKTAPRNVRFLGQLEDVAAVLKTLDLLVIPSRSEGQGIVALEAFASGCPVLAARVGGLAETVQDGVMGRLCEPGSSTVLEGAIKRLADDGELRGVLRENALSYIKKFGRVEQMCRAVEMAYRAVVDGRE